MNVRLMTIGALVLAVHVLVIGAFWLGLRKGESKRPPAEREDYAIVDEQGEPAPVEATEVAPQPRPQQTRPQETTPTPTAGAEPRVHVVSSGESFWRIANKYGVSVQALMAANNYGANDTLQVGAKLVIPPQG